MYVFLFLKIRNYYIICILNFEFIENIDGNWSSIWLFNIVFGVIL